jgi:hypothetical protein
MTIIYSRNSPIAVSRRSLFGERIPLFAFVQSAYVQPLSTVTRRIYVEILWWISWQSFELRAQCKGVKETVIECLLLNKTKRLTLLTLG